MKSFNSKLMMSLIIEKIMIKIMIDMDYLLLWLLLVSMLTIEISGFRSPPFNTNKLIHNKVKILQVAPSESIPDFNSLISLDDRCSKLSNLESEFLLSFWSDELQCFQIYPGNSKRVSITTSLISLNAIRENPQHWENRAAWSTTNNEHDLISIKNMLKAVQDTIWSGDTFQSQLLVQTFCQFADDTIVGHPKFSNAVDKLLERRARVSLHQKQVTSAYLRHQNVLALLSLVDSKLPLPQLKDTDDIGYALERANLVAFDEMCRQLAFYNSGDSAHYDVIILAYSLLSYWDTSNSVFLTSHSKGIVPSVNMKLVSAALEIIFKCQAEDGSWSKGEPISKSGDATGRDIGNNYVFFFDLVGAILGSVGKTEPQLLTPYLKNFERCISWAETNIQQELMPDVNDLSGQSFDNSAARGKSVKGWRSNHLGTGGAVAWCTAQVFIMLSRLRVVLRSLINSNVLAEFDGQEAPSSLLDSSSNVRNWKQLMDTDLILGGEVSTLKSELYARLLKPQKLKEQQALAYILPPNDKNSNSKEAQPTSYQPLYSAILFGPPGTAKTTICTSMASYLGWNFVTIDTACFLADGLQSVAARMRYIFSRLEALDRTIILFDEIEEFCLNRENPALGMESRMLTTAMLTQLNDLRRKQQSIFIVATNRLRSFDAAVTRPGRFDMLLFVGTPNLQARCDRLKQKLRQKEAQVRTYHDDSNSAVHILQHTEECFENYLRSNWDRVRFLSFSENESLMRAITAMAERGQSITVGDIEAAVSSLLRTATIQGQVKDEYIAIEALSRV